MPLENILIFILLLFLFVIADIYIRSYLKKSRLKFIKQKRTKSLNKGLQIDFSQEAPSLKRVEIKESKARIICVDDDPVILDSLRKILVLDGYSVDTVENGKEALSLLHFHHYDFIFIDLRMSGLDGAIISRAVRSMRPDIDIIIITGYATIESAVEMMKLGVLDYVQKPFTSDELLSLVEKCLEKRRKRIAEILDTKVHIASLDEFGKHKFGTFAIPGGVFISDEHCWVGLSQDGTAHIGIDDFANRLIGKIEEIELPNLGMKIHKGQPLFGIRCVQKYLPFDAPLSGEVIQVNKRLAENTLDLETTSYAHNWICIIQPCAIELDLKNLKIGQAAVEFFKNEIEECKSHLQHIYEEKKSEEALLKGNGSFSDRIKQLGSFERRELIKKFLGEKYNK